MMAKILVFDNYDSFTYNLVHLVEKITHQQVDVRRNDETDLEEIGRYDRIILSPGPGLPSEAGLLLPLIRQYASTKSILGVCLGHQAIGEVFGGKLNNLSSVYHGVSTPVHIVTNENGDPLSTLFAGVPDHLVAGRYHSWVVSRENFPEELEITATDDNSQVMALQHRRYDLQGVQFHPESILTPHGELILRNWLKTKN